MHFMFKPVQVYLVNNRNPLKIVEKWIAPYSFFKYSRSNPLFHKVLREVILCMFWCSFAVGYKPEIHSEIWGYKIT